MRDLLPPARPALVLAPMQDVTDLAFMRVMARYGGPDVFWTEYFRVHGDSRPEKWILKSITENSTGRPVVAQLIGNDIPALVRTAKLLQKFPVAAIDLNLGCPAPIVYRKCAGGGLLRTDHHGIRDSPGVRVLGQRKDERASGLTTRRGYHCFAGRRKRLPGEFWPRQVAIAHPRGSPGRAPPASEARRGSTGGAPSARGA